MTADPAVDVALALVQSSLICRLALQLDDAPLARRAAREAGSHARLLAGRMLPTAGELELHAAVVDPGATLKELLRLAYPRALLDDGDDLEDEGATDRITDRLPSRAELGRTAAPTDRRTA